MIDTETDLQIKSLFSLFICVAARYPGMMQNLFLNKLFPNTVRVYFYVISMIIINVYYEVSSDQCVPVQHFSLSLHIQYILYNLCMDQSHFSYGHFLFGTKFMRS